MNKYINDFIVTRSIQLTSKYQLLQLKPIGAELSSIDINPGQFVQVKTSSATTFLRRPISIHDVDIANNTISLLINRNGDGSNSICDTTEGDSLNLIYPLGNGFSLPDGTSKSILLVGGGVGVAPLLFLGIKLRELGHNPQFLLAARTAADVLRLDEFKKYGTVYVSTDDGSLGHKGLVTQNSILNDHHNLIYCCGPMPMMKAVADICKKHNIDCQVSLENTMACGVGACLCCVEKTVRGNRCVCTDGPIFNITELTW